MNQEPKLDFADSQRGNAPSRRISQIKRVIRVIRTESEALLRNPRNPRHQRASLSGFTLMEVLMVVVVVAILSSVALPQYRKTLEVNYRQQARDILTTIYYGERAYRLLNNKFVVPAAWNDIYMDNPAAGASPPSSFAVTAAAASTFTATATRVAGSGPCASRVLSINETRTIAGTWLACP